MAVETVQVPRANPRPPGAEDAVARRIASERASRGWSTAELARRMTDAGVPVNQSAIYKIEKGTPRRTVSLDEALALAQIFGLQSVEDLFMPTEALRMLRQIQSAVQRATSSTEDAADDLIDRLRDLSRRWMAYRASEGGAPSAESALAAERVVALVSAAVKMLTEARIGAEKILAEVEEQAGQGA